MSEHNLRPASPLTAARLLHAAKDLAGARDAQSIAAIARSAARQLTGADGVTFVLRDGNECFYVDEEAIAPLWKGRRFPLASCLSGWVMTHGQSVVIPDVFADARVPHDLYRPTFVKSLAMVPVRTVEPIAAIGAYWARCHQATDEELDALKMLADSAALALDNARLYEDLRATLMREQEARRVAETARRAKDELLALVAHELRQPLHASLAAVRVMEQGTPLPGGADAQAVVRRQLEQMSRLVEDLVDAARVVYGRVELSLETVHVPSLIAQVTESVTPLMHERQLQFIAVPPVRPVWIRVDACRMQQVMMNLLVNAAKFTDPGGVVRLSTQHNDSFVTMSVRDNGRGIDPALLPNIFDLFTRGAGDRAGFGVGLSVARRLTELHHGRLEARSDGPGTGSEFLITLPAMNAD